MKKVVMAVCGLRFDNPWQPERGHSSCLFQRGTLGGRPVGWGEETTVVVRHSPEHGFLRGVVELALELAHLEVRWSRGRCARRDVCVHTTISSGRRLCFWGEDRFFAGALHLSHKQGRAVPQARAQVPPHTGPIPSAARHVAHHQGPRSSPLAPPIHVTTGREARHGATRLNSPRRIQNLG